MKQAKQVIKKWHHRQSREMWIFWITVIVSIVIGYTVAYYFSIPISKWMVGMDSADLGFWLPFGATASIILFIGGFIKAKFKRVK